MKAFSILYADAIETRCGTPIRQYSINAGIRGRERGGGARGRVDALVLSFVLCALWSNLTATAQTLALPAVPTASAQHPYEYVMLCGGPSLHLWEKYKQEPHDNYWGCFVRAARTRIQQLEPQLRDNPSATITLLIYLDGYHTRSAQEHRDLIPLIYSVRDAYKLNLVPFKDGEDVVRYLNYGKPRGQIKIADFEYFGHSNQDAFMFDYSNQVGSCSKAWLHQNQLAQINRGIFAPGAYVKSWGCYTGESMSQKFRAATGTSMIGAVGRVDYSNRDEAVNGIEPVLSSAGGHWTR